MTGAWSWNLMGSSLPALAEVRLMLVPLSWSVTVQLCALLYDLFLLDRQTMLVFFTWPTERPGGHQVSWPYYTVVAKKNKRTVYDNSSEEDVSFKLLVTFKSLVSACRLKKTVLRSVSQSNKFGKHWYTVWYFKLWLPCLAVKSSWQNRFRIRLSLRLYKREYEVVVSNFWTLRFACYFTENVET